MQNQHKNTKINTKSGSSRVVLFSRILGGAGVRKLSGQLVLYVSIGKPPTARTIGLTGAVTTLVESAVYAERGGFGQFRRVFSQSSQVFLSFCKHRVANLNWYVTANGQHFFK